MGWKLMGKRVAVFKMKESKNMQSVGGTYQ